MIVPSGVGQGQRLVLREWQKRFIRDIYEPHGHDEDGNWGRIVRRAILSIGRKNGKTLIIAALALAHLHGPEAIENGEVYSAANDRSQAAQVYKFLAQMVRADPELATEVGLVDSTKHAVCYSNGSKYVALSADIATKHGLNPSVVIYDELAQSRSRELYDVLDTAQGARLEPLFAVISTQSNDPEHILSKLIDDGLHAGDSSIVCHLYAVPDDCPDIFDPKVWKKANPALGDFRSLAEMKKASEQAKRLPSFEPRFRNLYLNQRVSPVASLIARAEWEACKGDAALVDGEDIYLGLDLSSTTDLTALVAVSASNGSRVQAWFWKPQDFLADHSARDFGPGNLRYVEWAKQGLLLTTPGRSIDKAAVARTIAELSARYRILGLAYDRWRIGDLLREFDGVGLEAYEDGKAGSGLRLVPWGQGFRDMAGAVDALESAVLQRQLVHDGNPALTWQMANARAVMDPAGARKIDKSKARFRIDGAVALAMDLGLKARDRRQEPENDCSFVADPIFA